MGKKVFCIQSITSGFSMIKAKKLGFRATSKIWLDNMWLNMFSLMAQSRVNHFSSHFGSKQLASPSPIWRLCNRTNNIQNDGEINSNVNHKIQIGWLKWRVLCDCNILVRIKKFFYRTSINPVLLYGMKC